MKVVFNGDSARFYRGYTFIPGEPQEVPDDWFAGCSNPNFEAVKKRGRPPKVELPVEIETDGD